MLEFEGKYTSAKVMIDDIEPQCGEQIAEFINHPAFTKPVSIMPDCHKGMGCVIGFTMLLDCDNVIKIIPNTIGVDIGCGMLSVNVGKNIFSKLTKQEIDDAIRVQIPFGFNTHKKPAINMERQFPWEETNYEVKPFAGGLGWLDIENPPTYTYEFFEKKCKQIEADFYRAQKSLGTLGGGNHFIEIGRSENTGDYWVTVHSGSRNFGLCVCNYWQKLAIKKLHEKRTVKIHKRIEKIKERTKDKTQLDSKIQNAKKELGIDEFIPNHLAYLEGKDAHLYLYDMIFAQKFAEENRAIMMTTILDILGAKPQDVVESVHNYVDPQDYTIRKGAIRSVKGERMIIPFNMRDGLLICEGKNNPEWNNSAPHGAGRVMSRSKAKQKIDVETFKHQMDGVFSTSVGRGTLDEAPDAYKDASVIENAIVDTAIILDRIKPVMNLKDIGKEQRRRKGNK